MVAFLPLYALGLLASVQLVAGHGCITSATGDAGGKGTALGIDATTPRDGTTRKPFEQDTTRFKGDAAATFGETIEGGDNNPETGTQAVLAANGGTLPQITAGGSVTMTLHQVNSDGAGPYTCMINSDGTGTSWQPMTVTTQVAGTNGKNKAGEATDHPLAAAVPAGQTCTGNVAGQANVCMVRCQNPARAGPFGGVVPVQLASSAAGTATNSTAATSTTLATAVAATSTTAATTSTAADATAAAAADTASTATTAKTGKAGKTAKTAGTAAGTADTADTAADDEDEEDEEDTKKLRVRRRLTIAERRALAMDMIAAME